MSYPTDADFAEARQHRAPPNREPVIHVTNVGPHAPPDPGLVDALQVKVREFLSAPTTSTLSFADLRRANIARLPQFKNAKGELAHSEPDGSDWSDSDWFMAVTGELGEFGNLRKKVLRGDLTMEEALPELTNELADVVGYLDILAFRLGVDLGAAIASKFNRVSERVGCDVKLSTACQFPVAVTVDTGACSFDDAARHAISLAHTHALVDFKHNFTTVRVSPQHTVSTLRDYWMSEYAIRASEETTP